MDINHIIATSLNELRTVTRVLMTRYPNLSDALNDNYEQAVEEVGDGGSEDHEVELAVDHIVELLEEQNG